MIYVFVSFGSIHTGKPLGACIVQVENAEQANAETQRLGIAPDTCNRAYGYIMSDEDFQNQGMELNKFYDSETMERMGFNRG